MRLGDADRERPEAGPLVRVELAGRRRQVVDAVGAVDLGGDGLDLLPQRRLVVVEHAERRRAPPSPRRPPRPARRRPCRRPRSACRRRRARPTEAAISRMAACSEGKSPAMALMATTGVTPWRRTMARWARRLAAPSCTSSGFSSSMAGGSGRPATTRCRPECSFIALHRRHHDGGIGHQARRPALDVEEALRAHVGAEARLGDEVLARVDPDQVGHHRRVPVGDVAERPGVHEHRRVLERLQEVGLDGVAHDHRHGAGRLELLRRHRLAGGRVADHDAAHARAQVAQRRRPARGRPSPRRRR